ncbi:hypothetical protein L6164_035176 [Bauhinia variegata]|uniref:Uncharacterized protein n=1 Tax=Bauhinia variegata TaxID=167791 RepID=A0ACB9KXG1_BAUVA|nr:hypothetical protein L6164_035176 [Bauhinia variegata]
MQQNGECWFWFDEWTPSGKLSLLVDAVDIQNRDTRVRDVLENGYWHFHRLQTVIPEAIRRVIQSSNIYTYSALVWRIRNLKCINNEDISIHRTMSAIENYMEDVNLCMGAHQGTHREEVWVELAAIAQGEEEIRDITCYSDSIQTISLVQKAPPTFHTYAGILWQIKDLLDKEWHVSLHHTHKEGNASADILAKKGAASSDSPPMDALLQLEANAAGTLFLSM